MENAVRTVGPLRVGKKMRKRRELDALVGGPMNRGGRLLSASSDEGEPWGRRNTRRPRSRPFIRLAASLAFCVCVVSAVTVLWLFVDVRRQIVSLRVEMDRVSSSSASVSDSLQICHTAAKELKANATELTSRLSKLEKNHQELALRMEQATKELAFVSDQLSAAPKLADTPRRLAELQRTVADFGSQIKGFDSALASAKKQALTASSGVDEVRNLLHDLEGRTNDTIANITSNTKREEDMRSQFTALNSTMLGRFDEIDAKIRDINKPVSTTAPITLPAVNPTKTTNITEQQGPAKPFVLH